MQSQVIDYRARVVQKRESRAVGRSWGRMYGLLMRIRNEEAAELRKVYMGESGNKPIRESA